MLKEDGTLYFGNSVRIPINEVIPKVPLSFPRGQYKSVGKKVLKLSLWKRLCVSESFYPALALCNHYFEHNILWGTGSEDQPPHSSLNKTTICLTGIVFILGCDESS
ncbi:hypothetical protein CEXT_452151 [Caerostris extrusa]|uniref:Uncharacterized protein n=1 Tax=Caerostris extrusa TaxID=172846 RepID=A0AAV4SY81_CAEEX|nr:hypothetical protein CEXT_452151 [Caerostris extrusa]